MIDHASAPLDQSSGPRVDVLSDVLRAVRLTGAVFFDVHASAPWVAESPRSSDVAAGLMPGSQHVISFHVLASGACHAWHVGNESLALAAGDLVIFPHGHAHCLASEPGLRAAADMALFRRDAHPRLPVRISQGEGGDPKAHLICGFLGCDSRPFNPLLETLPPVMLVRADSGPGGNWMSTFVQTALAECSAPTPGGETVLARLSELLFIEALRRHVAGLPAETSGWLAGLRDPAVGQALGLMHAQPAEPWTLESLADRSGVSRSVIAQRFAELVGVPPMQYLARWRMQLAANLLATGTQKVAAIAREVGYEAEAAFSRAFKKLTGKSPSQWRATGNANLQIGAPGNANLQIGAVRKGNSASQETGDPRASQETGDPRASQETGDPRASQETGEPRASQETSVPRASQETGEPRASQETGVPGANPRGWHTRGYLPHWDGTRTQHVTIHLADSLPQDAVRLIDRELSRLPRDEQQVERRRRVDAWLDAGHGCCILRQPQVAAMVEEAFRHFHGKRYELLAWVVMPNHAHVLFRPFQGFDVSKLVASWKKYTAKQILDYARNANLPIGAVKKGNNVSQETGDPRASQEAGDPGASQETGDPRASQETGEPRASPETGVPMAVPKPVWHREYWDRFIRNDRHFRAVVDYIHNNPVKAGLTDRPERWPWSSVRHKAE